MIKAGASAMLRITFTTKVDAGFTDIEVSLLDTTGKAFCSAYYVSIR